MLSTGETVISMLLLVARSRKTISSTGGGGWASNLICLGARDQPCESYDSLVEWVTNTMLPSLSLVNWFRAHYLTISCRQASQYARYLGEGQKKSHVPCKDVLPSCPSSKPPTTSSVGAVRLKQRRRLPRIKRSPEGSRHK